MTLSESARNTLYNNPPSDTTEIYFECQMSVQDSLFDSVGTSVGNILTIRLGFILLLCFCLVTLKDCLRYFGIEREAHGVIQQDLVLKFLARTLLTIHDENSKRDSGTNRFGDGNSISSAREGVADMGSVYKSLATHPDIKRVFSSNIASNEISSDGNQSAIENPFNKPSLTLELDHEKAQGDLNHPLQESSATITKKHNLDLEIVANPFRN